QAVLMFFCFEFTSIMYKNPILYIFLFILPFYPLWADKRTGFGLFVRFACTIVRQSNNIARFVRIGHGFLRVVRRRQFCIPPAYSKRIRRHPPPVFQ
ncbi:MAG: hypothetical protein IJL59_06145, partial [Clostridia bacterium]|nr:hypothetical protein [Clostridia bacterium]